MTMPPLDLSLIQQLLTSKTIVDEISDVNDLTTSGFYFVKNANLANLPISSWCYVFVNASTSKNRIIQICFDDGGKSVYFRVKTEIYWSDWERFVTATDLQNSMTKIDDQTILSKWDGMLSYKNGVSYTIYSVTPSAIIAQQTPTSDLTFYFKFILPAKPEYITDDHPRPLGISTFASNLHETVNTLSDKVILSRDSNTVIEPQLTIYNPYGGHFIYSARSSATGLFTDKANSMFIATNTDQQPDAPEVEWGQTVIMAINCHEVKNNPFQGA